jgi:hypothetical protein
MAVSFLNATVLQNWKSEWSLGPENEIESAVLVSSRTEESRLSYVSFIALAEEMCLDDEFMGCGKNLQ